MSADGLVVLKLGGALITDKTGVEAPRRAVVDRLAAEIAAWPPAHAGGLAVGHGSGSYAHVAVRDTSFLDRPRDRRAFAAVAAAAARLDAVVRDALVAAGLPAVAVPGGLLARCRDGEVVDVDVGLLRRMLGAGLLPLTWGDVALDPVRGACVASTEPLLAAVAQGLGAARLVIATDVDGVYEQDPASVSDARPVARLTPGVRAALELGGARPGATDISGGMASKVDVLLALAAARPALEIRIVSGLRPGAVAAALRGAVDAGGTVVASH